MPKEKPRARRSVPDSDSPAPPPSNTAPTNLVRNEGIILPGVDDATPPRTLASARDRREAAATMSQRISEAPSQSSLDAQATPNRAKKRTRTRGSINLLKKASIQAHFLDEVCSNDSVCKAAEVRNQYEEQALKDASGHSLHLRCRYCKEVFHSHCESTYNMHLNHHCSGISRDVQTPKAKEISPHEFWHKVFPTAIASTNIPLSVAVRLFRQLEEVRPDAPSEVMRREIPKTVRSFENDIVEISHVLWEKILGSIDEYDIFGVAIDGGTDQVLSEHIMVVVLYVGPFEWILPPMYHPRRGSFNGAEIGMLIVNDLRRHLGAARLAKWAYIIADGAAVNHVARDEAESELADFFHRLSRLGTQDWTDVSNSVRSAIHPLENNTQTPFPKLVLIPCVGQFLNNVAKSALTSWTETPIFKLRKGYMNSFHSGAKLSGRKGVSTVSRGFAAVSCGFREIRIIYELFMNAILLLRQ